MDNHDPLTTAQLKVALAQCQTMRKGSDVEAPDVSRIPPARYNADVQPQGNRVSARTQPETGGVYSVRIDLDPAGRGLWIPWLGQGLGPAQHLHGSSPCKGWGTYCDPIAADSDIEWVVTGFFSGCYAACFEFSNAPQTFAFAHLITPGDGYTAASVEDQQAAIIDALPGDTTLRRKWDMRGDGLGVIFWMRADGIWVERKLFVFRSNNHEGAYDVLDRRRETPFA